MKMAVFIRTVFFVAILSMVSCTSESVDEIPSVEAFNVQQLETELHSIVNSYRTTEGLTPLQFSAVAYDLANEHNDYMIAKGGLSHDNFNSRASKIASETEAKEVAENVARDYQTAKATLQGWLDSAPHKINIEGDFTHTAISVKQSVNGNIYYTQIFFR